MSISRLTGFREREIGWYNRTPSLLLHIATFVVLAMGMLTFVMPWKLRAPFRMPSYSCLPRYLGKPRSAQICPSSSGDLHRRTFKAPAHART